MKGLVRIVLVDPDESSRREIQRTLAAVPSVWVAEVLGSYQEAVQRVSETAPDLTMVTIDSDPRRAIELIQQLFASRPQSVVLPTSRARDSSIILGVFRAGAREFLTLPSTADELSRTIERLARPSGGAAAATNRGPHIIAVTGGGGGLGSTTLAVNLGTSLAKNPEHAVALADFDLLLGSVDASLDIVPDQTLVEVAANVDRLDMTLLQRALTRHSSGLYVLPRPNRIDDLEKIDPEAVRRVLNLMKATFASVVIDTSKGLQEPDVIAYEMADVILMVVQLDLICLRNTARLLNAFRQTEGLFEKIKLVANRVGSHDLEISQKKAEEALKAPITWLIPNATKPFYMARVKGQPLSVENAGSRAHQVILDIAHALRPFPVEEVSRPKRGLFAALF